jgi:RHS repeat-associated protein
VPGAERNERVDEANHGALIFFRERGHHLKSLPQAAGLGAVGGALDFGRLLDASGNPKEKHDYLPFGEEISTAIDGRDVNWGGPDPTQKFTSKERDAESGLDYFLARYMSSAQGRFTSPDDVNFSGQNARDPQSWNLYTYVRNNPLLYTDPNGHDYHVCVDNGQGGQNCFNLTDAQYQNLYKQQNGQQGIGLPTPQVGGGGAVTCGGSDCGSVSYFEPSLYDPVPGAVATAVAADLGGRFVLGPVLGRIGAALAPSAAKVLARLGRPAWAESAGGFVNWLKNLQRAGKSLTSEEADAVISEAKRLNVDVRLDPPHPGTDWDVPHLNIGKEGQVHLEVPSGYDNLSVPKGSVRNP